MVSNVSPLGRRPSLPAVLPGAIEVQPGAIEVPPGRDRATGPSSISGPKVPEGDTRARQNPRTNQHSLQRSLSLPLPGARPWGAARGASMSPASSKLSARAAATEAGATVEGRAAPGASTAAAAGGRPAIEVGKPASPPVDQGIRDANLKTMGDFRTVLDVFKGLKSDPATMKANIQSSINILGQDNPELASHMTAEGVALLGNLGPGMLAGQDLESLAVRRGYAQSRADAIADLLKASPGDTAAVDGKIDEIRSKMTPNLQPATAKLMASGLAAAQVQNHVQGKGKIPTDPGEVKAFATEKFIRGLEARIKDQGYRADWHSSPEPLRSIRDATLKELDRDLAKEDRPASGLADDPAARGEMDARGVAFLLGMRAIGRDHLERSYPDTSAGSKDKPEAARVVSSARQLQSTYGAGVFEAARNFITSD